MAEVKTLAAAVRSGSGKGAARSVRREGRTPAVIYGGGDAPETITLDYKELNKLIYAGHFLTTIFDIDINGRKERVLPRDYQLDVVRDTPLHVDFLRLRPGSSLRVDVPVHFINQDICPGIKKGGALNIVLHSVEMRVPADAIPDAITIDLAKADINDSLYLSSVTLSEGCRAMVRTKGEVTVANITPQAVVEEAPVVAAAPAKGKAAAKPAAKK